jgi:predicted nuclease of predicted toxin-antitoxin system
MKFLIDAQLPPALCRWLREHGHEAVHVSEIGMLAASDAAVADRAEAEGEMLVSKDEDFVVLRMPDRFVLLWLRCGNTTNAALAVWLEARWERAVSLLRRSERFVELR